MSLHGRRWTRRDDSALRLLWGLPLDSICRELGRTPASLYSRATVLGLRHGVPPEGECPRHAARRTGYAPETLAGILRWARAHGLQVEARRRLSLSSRRRWYDPEQVDAAVAMWLRSETVTAAAERYGVAATTMRRWLCAAGYEPPRSGRHWRLMPEDFDAVAGQRMVA